MRITLGELRKLIKEQWFSDWLRTGAALTPAGGNMRSSSGSSGFPPPGLGEEIEETEKVKSADEEEAEAEE